MGNYLATMHRQGVAVWGGPSFQRLARYSHQNVQLIEFSPAEKYLMTYSSIEPSNPREKVQVSSQGVQCSWKSFLSCDVALHRQ
jgi:translation initiation factor 3 subunit B